MKNHFLISIFLLFIFLNGYTLISQTSRLPEKGNDSTIIFKPARPLIDTNAYNTVMKSVKGIDLLFSNYGFGFGAFYQHLIANDTYWFCGLYFTEAKNSNEFLQFDPYLYYTYIPNKLNEIYMFPLTAGIQKYILKDVLSETFKPFVNCGFGPTFLISSPYNVKRFLSAELNLSKFYTRFGAFIGLGCNIGTSGKTMTGLNIRYYYIPFGGKGLESIRDEPITNFGGLFLSLSFAIAN